jgi:hypothetical protein
VLVPSDKNLLAQISRLHAVSIHKNSTPISQLPHRILSDELDPADALGTAPHLVIAPLFLCTTPRHKMITPYMVPLLTIILASLHFGETMTTPAQYP